MGTIEILIWTFFISVILLALIPLMYIIGHIIKELPIWPKGIKSKKEPPSNITMIDIIEGIKILNDRSNDNASAIRDLASSVNNFEVVSLDLKEEFLEFRELSELEQAQLNELRSSLKKLNDKVDCIVAI